VNENELSIPEIAKLANVNEKTVRYWMDNGKLPVSQTIKQGQQRRRYATKAAVDQWLATMRESEEPTPEATSRPTNTPTLASC
jgi:excisionase family DNA binding protein